MVDLLTKTIRCFLFLDRRIGILEMRQMKLFCVSGEKVKGKIPLLLINLILSVDWTKFRGIPVSNGLNVDRKK